MRTILCDADVLAYKAASHHQNLTERRPGCFTLYASGPKAVKQVDDQVEGLMHRLDADRIIMVLSDVKDNFRKKILKSYKENRKLTVRPLSLGYVHEHIKQKYETLFLPTLEGDDLVGILATGDEYVDGEKIVVSIDKDFNTIPGTHYNQDKDELRSVGVEEADRYHLFQTLVGDACDNYKGCPGVGPVKAKRALEGKCGKAAWDAVVFLYKAAGLTEIDALIQARCARILRSSDFDWDKREIKFWEPERN